MFSKKLTIFLIPESGSSVKQFGLSKRFLGFTALILAVFSVSGAFVLKDYLTLKPKASKLAMLEQVNTLQEQQLIHMAGRIDVMTREMAALKKKDIRLKKMATDMGAEDYSKFKGMGGSDAILLNSKNNLKKADRKLVLDMHQSLDQLESEIDLSRENQESLEKFLDEQKTLLASTPSIWPTRGWLSSRFGYRKSPFNKKREFHKGIDISTRSGAPIVSPANGLVVFNGWLRGYGRVLVIKHPNGFKTKYAHLKKALVKKGRHVKRGETIGLVGRTGRTTGSHLHYEVHLNNVPVNPLRYIFN